MSTVFYGYRVEKKIWWGVVNDIRKFYDTEYPYAVGLRKLMEERKSVDDLKKRTASLRDGLAIAAIDQAHVSLQVFDFDEWYVFRVLEQGYFFMNNHEKFPLLEECYYDDRSENEDNNEYKELVDWVDEEIKQRRYFIYPLVDEESLSDIVFSVR